MQLGRRLLPVSRYVREVLVASLQGLGELVEWRPPGWLWQPGSLGRGHEREEVVAIARRDGIPHTADWLVLDDLAVEMELDRQIKDLRPLLEAVTADGRVTPEEMANVSRAIDQAEESSAVSKAYNRRFLARDFEQVGHAEMRRRIRKEQARRRPGSS